MRALFQHPRPAVAIVLGASLAISWSAAGARAGAGVTPSTHAANRSLAASPYERLLRDAGIEPGDEGLVEYLRGLHPSPAQREAHLRLIERLGSPDFAEREAASQELAALPAPPVKELIAASSHADPEVRWRTKRILALSDRSAVLFAVLRSIQWRQAEHAESVPEHAHAPGAGPRVARPGLRIVPELLAAVPLCDRPHLKAAARDALRASAGSEDADVLRQALDDADPEVRAAAALTLPAAAGREALADLVALLGEPAEPEVVRLAVARALGELGDRRSLRVLVELLASDELAIRAEAVALLRAVTGESFQFSAYAEPRSRTAAVEQWRAWLKAHGETAPLRHPRAQPDWGDSSLGGHTLLAFGYQNRAVELGLDRREVWSYSMRGVFSAEKLPSGNVLMAVYGPNRVIEVDPHGQVVWEFADQPALNARLLASGNVLIAGHTSKKVVEVTRDRQVIWQFDTPQNCYDAHRLPGGNTLLATGQQVLEITPEGRTLWSHRANGSVYGIQPLPGGNVLLCDTSRGAIEVTRGGVVVWEFAEGNAFDAFRLPDGNTLVSSNKRFVEVSPEGKIVWELAGGGYGRARR